MKRPGGLDHAFALLALGALCSLAAPASAQPYSITSFTVAGGGTTTASGGGYALAGTAGQADAGAMNGAGYTLTGGFWSGILPVTPALTIANASVTEGNSGSVGATFDVTLSFAGLDAIQVGWATQNGSAVASADYQAGSGSLSFPAGTTTQIVTVQVLGDALNEANETFGVLLSSASGATIANPAATGTIADDDPFPALTIDDAAVTEGHAGQTPAVFNVRLSAPSGQTVSVQYATQDGTAIAGADYTACGGSLAFAAGETALTLGVPVLGDRRREPSETFLVNLTAPLNATLPDNARGIGTIRTDDVGRDLGGDGRADIVWRKTAEGVDKGALFLWSMDGTGLASARYLDPISEDWQVLFTGDFNGDGKSDVLWRNFGAGAEAGSLYIWMMDGPNVAGGTGYTAAQANLGWRVDAVGDLDGDGKDDIVWRKAADGVDKGALFLWTMDGTGLAGARYLDPISEDWRVLFTGDFNGDGKSDVLWRNFGTGADAGRLFVWLMDGPNVVGGTGYTAAQADLGWRVDAVGDLDGDGKADIVWRKTAAGVDRGAAYLWTMNGTGLTGARYLDPIDESWQIQGLADFNGDGKSDVLWRNFGGDADAGKLYVWMMNGPIVTAGTGYTAAQADLGWRIESPRR
jgi:hypothetical protein